MTCGEGDTVYPPGDTMRRTRTSRGPRPTPVPPSAASSVSSPSSALPWMAATDVAEVSRLMRSDVRLASPIRRVEVQVDTI